jgi:hypothetical protein
MTVVIFFTDLLAREAVYFLFMPECFENQGDRSTEEYKPHGTGILVKGWLYDMTQKTDEGLLRDLEFWSGSRKISCAMR